MDFTPKQQHSLLSKMGYNGPADPKLMEAFLSSNPGAAAKMGKFATAAQKMAPVKGLAEGGSVEDPLAQGKKTVEDLQKQLQDFGEIQTFDTDPGKFKWVWNEVSGNMQRAVFKNDTTGETRYGTWKYGSNVKDLVRQEAEPKLTELNKPAQDYQKFLQYQDVQSQLDTASQSVKDLLMQGTGQTVDLDQAKQTVANLTNKLAEIGRLAEANPDIQAYQDAFAEAQKEYAEAQSNLNIAQTQFGITGTPTPGELVAKATTTPMDLTTKSEVSKLGTATPDQLISQTAGQADTQVAATTTTAGPAATAAAPTETPAATYTADQAAGAVKEELQGVERDYKSVSWEDAGFTPPPAGTFDTLALETFHNPTTGEQVTVFSGGYTAPEGWVKGPPKGKFKTEGLTAATGTVSQQVTAATLDATKLAQLKLSPAQIEQVRQVVDTGDLQVTEGQLAEAATLANQGIELPQAIAQVTGQPEEVVAAKFASATPQAEAVIDYNIDPTKAAQLLDTEIKAAAKAAEFPTTEAAQSSYESTIQAAQGQVGAMELVNAKDVVKVAEAIEATAATMEALDQASVAQAQQGTLSQSALASTEQGVVPAAGTVAGQLSKLMEQFNDGTPAWAAGAMRAANAAMAARGLGASSMAGAAIVQASMEAAMPIAQADAQAFMQMELTNLSNRQQVALSNAAAQQNIELANLNNLQQVALQNSANSFALQSQNLSNQQAVVLANVQMKSALQGQVLDIYTQAAVVNAARYAEMSNINLNNEQQTMLQRSAQNLQVNLANLDNEQQAALANLQVRAALRGQELSNEQQVAMLESTQNFQRAEFNANAKQQAFMQDAAAHLALQGKAMDNRQQTALFNISNILQEREIELNNEQQTRIFNATNRLNVDLANLNNRQQTALANAQIEAALRGQELTNAQQAGVINASRISEIANLNFTADQERALQNAKLAQTVDIENLNARSAKVLADAAAMANVDLTNLNNRQQAQVQNAQNFLSMDLANLNNEQQTEMFRSQATINAMLSDQAAQNAALQFNAASQNQTDQFFANLASTVSTFNAAQKNAIAQFNAGEANATERFNAQLESAREQFNAANSLIIAQANAQWNQKISTIDTAEQNEANRNAAATANALTLTALNEVFQKERDLMDFAFTSAEGAADRALNILLADKTAALSAAQQASTEDASKSYLWTRLAYDFVSSGTGSDGKGPSYLEQGINWLFGG